MEMIKKVILLVLPLAVLGAILYPFNNEMLRDVFAIAVMCVVVTLVISIAFDPTSFGASAPFADWRGRLRTYFHMLKDNKHILIVLFSVMIMIYLVVFKTEAFVSLIYMIFNIGMIGFGVWLVSKLFDLDLKSGIKGARPSSRSSKGTGTTTRRM